jgi:hypothetical protein
MRVPPQSINWRLSTPKLGDKDQTFATLNEAIDEHDQFIGFMKTDPFMNPLRGDPRFQGLVKKVGFPQ